MPRPLPPEPPAYRGIPITDPTHRVVGTFSIVYFSRNSAVINLSPCDTLTVHDTTAARPVALRPVAVRRRHDNTWYTRHGGSGLSYVDRPGVPVRQAVAETAMRCLLDTVAAHYTADIGTRANLAHAASGSGGKPGVPARARARAGTPTGTAASGVVPSPRRAVAPLTPSGLLESSGLTEQDTGQGVAAADVLPALAAARRAVTLFGYELAEPLPLPDGRVLDQVLVRPAGDLPASAYGRTRDAGDTPASWITLPASIAEHVVVPDRAV